MASDYKKALCVGVALAAMMMLATGCSNAKSNEARPQPAIGESWSGEQILNQTETEPPVQVVMPEYEMTYSGVMSDLMRWEELTQETGLQFYIKLSNGEVPLFQMCINQSEGNIVVMKENGAGQKIPIAFRMHPAPEGISPDEKQIYGLAQELVNDIIASFTLK